MSVSKGRPILARSLTYFATAGEVAQIPPIAPPSKAGTRSSGSDQGLTRIRVSSSADSRNIANVRDELFRSLQNLDNSIPASAIDEALQRPELPRGVSLISLRASLIQSSRKLNSNTVIVCLELFGEARIPDHLFFKEMGNALLSRVPTMSISDICRVLRAHALVNVTETDLFKGVYGRLSSIINRATMDQIRDILWALATLNASLVDCMRMAELCMNRYSLSVKDESPLVIDKDILSALAKLGMQNSRIIKKATNRVLLRPSEVSSFDLVHIIISLARLGSDITPIYKILKSRLSDRHSYINPNLVTDTLPAIVSCLGAIDCAFVIQEANGRDEMSQFKSRFALFSSYLLEREKFESELRKLSFQELIRIEALLEGSTPVNEMATSGCFVKVKYMDLQRIGICGLFNTNIVRYKQEKASVDVPNKKKSKKIRNS